MADVYDFFKAAARLGRIDPPESPPAESPSRKEPHAGPIFRPTGPFASVSANLLGALKTLTRVETTARSPDAPAGPDMDR